jgi:F-type H+-transporting ATPase subunit epsilon
MAETAPRSESDRTLRCVIVTPEKSVLDESADFVALPMFDGELGVMPGRSPLIGRLGAGELRIRRGNQTQRYYVDGGFAQIRGNVVSVLTQRAVSARDIDRAAAQRALEATAPPNASTQERASQQTSKERARAQLRVAQHADA